MLKEPKASFNKAKDSYHKYDMVQRKIEIMLQSLIFKYLKHVSRVLELGCGDGVSSIVLHHKLHAEQYDALDIADALISKANQKKIERQCSSKQIEVLKDIRFWCGDFDSAILWQQLPSNYYDLAYSNMAMQWSKKLSDVLVYLKTVISEEGVFAFSLPLPGTFQELSSIACINTFISHSALLSLLQTNGWKAIEVKKETIIITFKSRLAQLRHLKQTGVNSYQGSDDPKVTSLRRYLQQDNGKPVQLSYVIGLYILKKEKNKYR